MKNRKESRLLHGHQARKKNEGECQESIGHREEGGGESLPMSDAGNGAKIGGKPQTSAAAKRRK